MRHVNAIRPVLALAVAGLAAAGFTIAASRRSGSAPAPGSAAHGAVARIAARAGTTTPAPITGTDSPRGLELRLSDAKPEAPRPDAAPPRVEPLDDAEVARLLARLPQLKERAGDVKAVSLPPAPVPPPRSGVTVRDAWPPKPQGPPPMVAASALGVLRHSPDGNVDLAPGVSLTFSQPMVAVASVDDVAASQVPVTLTPKVDGRWRWLGTRTLVFEGPEGRRLPMATRYEVAVPAGASSAAGGKLAKEVRFAFATPAPRVLSMLPQGAPQPRDPLMAMLFDQRVDASQVLRHLRVTAAGGDVPVVAAECHGTSEDARAIASWTGTTEEGRCVAFRAAQELPLDTEVSVVLGRGTPSAEGPLTTPADQSYSFRTYGPFRVTEHRCGWQDRCPPGSGFWIGTTNPVDPATVSSETVTVEPSFPDMVIGSGGNGIWINGPSRPRTRYVVTLSPHLKDTFGQELGRSAPLTFDVGPAEPRLWTAGGPLVVLDPSQPARWSVFSVGQRTLDVRLYAVTPDDWPAFQRASSLRSEAEGRRLQPPGRAAWSGIVTVDGPADDIVETPIDLSPALRAGLGHVVAVVDPGQPSKDLNDSEPAAWIEVTHVGLAAFVDQDTLLAWATRLEDGVPLPGVELSIAPDGASATSRDAGLARLALPASAGKGFRRLVGRQGDDVAFLPEQVGWWDGAQSSWVHREPGSSTVFHVQDDRGVYKPGETAHLVGWVRRIDGGPHGDVGLDAAAHRVSWELFDSTGNSIGKGAADVGTLGGFDVAVDLPPGMNLGYGRVDMSLDSGGSTSHPLRVEEFRRPEYEVTVSAPPEPLVVGESTVLSAGAKYYSGGPLAGADVTWSLQASETTWRPAGWDEYAFGTWTPWWMEGRWGGRASRSYSFASKTDVEGVQRLLVEAVSVDPPRPHLVAAEVTVQDVNRQAWSARTQVVVHPSSLYVGLRAARLFVQEGDTLPLDVVVTDLDGHAVPGARVHVRAVRTVSTWSLGTWKQSEEDEQTCDPTSAEAPVRCEVQLSKAGTWQISARLEDSKGRPNETTLTEWVAGPSEPGPRALGQQQVELIPDKAEYAAGDVARLLVRAPFAKGSGLLTLRRSGLLDERAFELAGGSAVLEIPVEESWTPNAWAQVDVVGSSPRVDEQGQPVTGAPPRPAFATGSIELRVPPRARTLHVEMQPAAAELEPGIETAVDVMVTDASGHPASGEVAVIVADESVLALTGFQLGDPLATFYGQRSPDVSDLHLRSSVVLPDSGQAKEELAGEVRGGTAAPRRGGPSERYERESSMAMDAAAPAPMAQGMMQAKDTNQASSMADEAKAGSAGGAIALRSDLRALAFFAPHVAVSRDGRAHVPWHVPDSLTRWRVMAIAVSGERSFGKGESTVTARRALMVRPSPPRFLNFGDRLELPVVVQNLTDKSLPVEVAVRLTNATLEGPHGLRVTVPARDRVEVRFPARSDEAGTARLQAVAASGRLDDAAEMSLPVYTPATSEAFATYGVLDDGAVVQPVQAPSDALPQVGGLSMTTSSTALSELGDAVLYLAHYPYECSEQLASRVLGVAAMRDMLDAFSKLPPRAEIEGAVAHDVDTLVRRQREDGGFGLWRLDSQDWPYASVHAAHALLLADAKGFAVPKEALDRSRAYLRAIKSHIPSDYGAAARRAIEAYALSVRGSSRDGDPEAARALVAETGVKDLPAESAGWLLPTLWEASSTRPLAEQVLQRIQDAVTETAADATIATGYGDDGYLLMWSERRVDGIVLEALTAIGKDGDLGPKLVRGLLDHRTAGHWDNTQENALILLGLDRYFRAHESAAPDFVATAWIGNAALAAQTFHGRSTEHRQVDLPMAQLLGLPTGEHARDVVISKTGPGRLYYRLGLDYAPKSLRLDPSDQGFAVERTYASVDGSDAVKQDSDGTWHVKSGSLVRVHVQMTAGSRRTHVALVDPLPAGLEILNTGLEVTQRQAPARGSTGDVKRGGWWWWGAWYEHQNLRDERAEAFASLLQAGVYDYEYDARATTPGTFVVPPAKAEEMYHPETFGRSATATVVVE